MSSHRPSTPPSDMWVVSELSQEWFAYVGSISLDMWCVNIPSRGNSETNESLARGLVLSGQGDTEIVLEMFMGADVYDVHTEGCLKSGEW